MVNFSFHTVKKCQVCKSAVWSCQEETFSLLENQNARKANFSTKFNSDKKFNSVLENAQNGLAHIEGPRAFYIIHQTGSD